MYLVDWYCQKISLFFGFPWMFCKNESQRGFWISMTILMSSTLSRQNIYHATSPKPIECSPARRSKVTRQVKFRIWCSQVFLGSMLYQMSSWDNLLSQKLLIVIGENIFIVDHVQCSVHMSGFLSFDLNQDINSHIKCWCIFKENAHAPKWTADKITFDCINLSTIWYQRNYNIWSIWWIVILLMSYILWG